MIQVKNLLKNHGQLRVLDGVTLSVQRGEVATIVGPSGGGKSTLLRCINGLDTFDSGEITVFESNADQLRLHPGANHQAGETLRSLRRRVGMVFQQFNLFPHMNVLENVLAGPQFALGRTRAQCEPEARELLARVGLAEKLAAMPDQLSGGQQQRVAIARTLAMHPEAILFDEPTSALDPRMAAEVIAVIADLAAAGQTMIVVTHAMHFARDISTTIHVMHAGRIAESGPPDAIFENATQEVTRAFLAQARAT